MVVFKFVVSFAVICCSLLNSPVAHAQATYVEPSVAGQNWGSVDGLLMFRGNPQRNFYGTGPLPITRPPMAWRYPEKPMCASSCVGQKCTQWCGLGWTGQPAVKEYKDGKVEVIFGAYDRNVHFLDGITGKPVRKSFPTNDIIKGSVTIDPDNYPLIYFGSRDNKYRIVAFDSNEPRELWSMDGHDAKPRVWDDDWDGNGVIVNDYLFIGGENSWFYIVKLNRSYDRKGNVQVNPKKVFEFPAFSKELMELTGDRMMSIESSPVLYKDRVYFANSAGYVAGFDISRLDENIVEKVFEFWAGDDIDGTPVVDKDGYLYISVELELERNRSRTASATQVQNMGQLIKLDPYKESPPIGEQLITAEQHPNVVWNMHIPARKTGEKGGIWSSPAIDLERNILYVTTHPGDLKAVDTLSGKEIWSLKLGFHEWSSPILIGNHLLVGRCHKAGMQLFDVSDTSGPKSLWESRLPGGCVESTPAVWNGRIYVGARDGYFYSFAAE